MAIPGDSSWIFGCLSGALIAWISGWIGARFERRKRASETQLSLFQDTISDLLAIYRTGLSAGSAVPDPLEWHCQRMAVLGRLSVWGTVEIMDSYGEFVEYVQTCLAEHVPADEPRLRQLMSGVTYAMCCEVHGERHKPPATRTSTASRRS
ncbi:MAG TPA: hypothetical protein VM487_04610 [Phycisphaerae bacterium]|nr:hypothetical protein [Phycisphaerae bacterium]